jgi:periplasmic protein TonB
MADFDDEDEDVSFVRRHRGLVIIVVILVLGVGVYFASKALSGGHTSSRSEDMTEIRLPPMPPPPPPKIQPTPPPLQTPPPEQVPDQKMVEQQPVQDEKKEEAPKEKPDAPAPLGTSITGPGGGPDLGLGSGLGGGGGYGSGGGGGTKYGWYASQVQSKVADALRSNPKTRSASLNVVARIWIDSSGRITKARISGENADATLSSVVQDDILTGLQLSDPPPADMPLPIVMRISARRPQ